MLWLQKQFEGKGGKGHKNVLWKKVVKDKQQQQQSYEDN
jgi:hypothetical protein